MTSLEISANLPAFLVISLVSTFTVTITIAWTLVMQDNDEDLGECISHAFNNFFFSFKRVVSYWYSIDKLTDHTFSHQFSCSVISDYLWPHGLQHARLPCPSPIPKAYSNSCPLSQWCHPTILSSVIPFSSCLQSFPASGSFPMSQLFASGGQSIGVSALASVLPMNIQDWFPLGLTGLISLKSKGFSRVFNTTVQKNQFFSSQLSL